MAAQPSGVPLLPVISFKLAEGTFALIIQVISEEESQLVSLQIS